MKRSPSLQFLAAASTTTVTTTVTTMSSRPYFRGGSNQGRRNYSDQPPSVDQQQPQQQIVTGDSHFHSVRDANRGFSPSGNFSSNRPQRRPYTPRPPPPFQNPPPPYYPNFNPNQHFYVQPPPLPAGQSSEPNQQYYRSQRPRGTFNFMPPQQYHPRPRPRPHKPLDYRNWEYAEPRPPPQCERFTILSYNILADYLAITHRAKLYIHIPPQFLDWQWRKRSIIFELGLWSADILCFQEVDRFQELEEDLKLQGYNGIWKMRTGDPVDGCAILWRLSRFKLVHEESIEFNKLGLRDNVAQICVFESVGCNGSKDSAPSTSSTHHNKVVVCNIHVLFNPRRGEIKLGQIRVLFDRAYAVSKLWDEAPVVICGDFNSTPESPLYNFIAGQKLDLSELPRDKVSGQASAEIPPQRPFNNSVVKSAVNSAIDSPVVNGKETEEISSSLTVHNGDHFKINIIMNESSVTSVTGKNANENDDEPPRGTHHDKEDSSKAKMTSCGSEQSPSNFDQERESPISVLRITPKSTSVKSSQEDVYSGVTESGYEKKESVSAGATLSASNECLDSGPATIAESFGNEDRLSTTCGTNTTDSIIAKESVETLGLDASSSANGEDYVSTSSRFDAAHGSTIDFLLDGKMEKLSLTEVLGGSNKEDSLGEDCNTFLSELHNTDSPFPSDSGKVQRTEFEDLADSPKEFSHEVLDDASAVDSEVNGVERYTYDPSAWTPLEIETATGSADRTAMDHPLKLKSVYKEVEDCSGTRDSSGEPIVTSYHRNFLGTVDYIWRSEGLQTVRVLAPIPKHAMQWTRGFPTKKWGSDHIALVSELAFTKHISAPNTEVQ